METGDVSRRLKIAMDAARAEASARRAQDARASTAYEALLANVAVPLARQLAGALKAEGLTFTVFTPAGGLRLASDRHRDDFIELALEPGPSGPEVVGRVSHARGSRTLAETMPIKDGASPDALTEEDVLAFLVSEIGPFVER